MIYDVAIIGTGPAGLSAALNFKLHNKNIIWFGSKNLSNKVEKSEKIANYPGFGMISGRELNNIFQEQIKNADLEITDKMVTNIVPAKDGFMLLGDNEVYNAKTILLATGTVSANPLKGEKEFLGCGVSYCATCDGFLYKNKVIAVICGDKKYEHEAAYLAGLADKVYLMAVYKDCAVSLPNVVRVNKAISEIKGIGRAQTIVFKDGDEFAVDGVFILRNSIAPSTLIKGIKMDGPHIMVDRNMTTSIKGIYAAGDCTGRPYQITKAVGEGNIAAHAILEYLA